MVINDLLKNQRKFVIINRELSFLSLIILPSSNTINLSIPSVKLRCE